MEDINEDKTILNELKEHFKELSSDIIEMFYQENNKDISKTIDALIANINLMNSYDNNPENKEPKEKDDNINNNKEEDLNDDDDFNLIKEEDEKESKIEDKNKIEQEKDKDEEDIDEEKVDDDVLNFLIELAPFHTREEIEQKMISLNFDIDRVISNLLDESNESNSNPKQEKNNNQINLDNNFKDIKRPKKQKKPKEKRQYREYNEYNVLEFLEKNKFKQRIDLHGFKLSESMIIVKKKLEEMEKIARETKSQKLLIIVTGRGNHSPGGKPVLRPNILRWLKRQKYEVNERDPGALYVLIK